MRAPMSFSEALLAGVRESSAGYFVRLLYS